MECLKSQPLVCWTINTRSSQQLYPAKGNASIYPLHPYPILYIVLGPFVLSACLKTKTDFFQIDQVIQLQSKIWSYKIYLPSMNGLIIIRFDTLFFQKKNSQDVWGCCTVRDVLQQATFSSLISMVVFIIQAVCKDWAAGYLSLVPPTDQLHLTRVTGIFTSTASSHSSIMTLSTSTKSKRIFISDHENETQMFYICDVYKCQRVAFKSRRWIDWSNKKNWSILYFWPLLNKVIAEIVMPHLLAHVVIASLCHTHQNQGFLLQ